jgi:AcrR family transcriptional regulator
MAANEAADVEPARHRDAGRTRAEILTVAAAEFADRGYNGARVDEIAARTRTTKRMIYYYFGGKKQLYIAALEQAYARIRAAEQAVDVQLPPIEAIRRVAEITFDHHEANPDFIRLVSIENIHRGEHISRLPDLVDVNTPAVRLLERLLDHGRRTGEIRSGIDAVDLHMMISAYCFFRVANQHTFGTIFGRDLLDPVRRADYRSRLGDMIVAYLTR